MRGTYQGGGAGRGALLVDGPLVVADNFFTLILKHKLRLVSVSSADGTSPNA